MKKTGWGILLLICLTTGCGTSDSLRFPTAIPLTPIIPSAQAPPEFTHSPTLFPEAAAEETAIPAGTPATPLPSPTAGPEVQVEDLHQAPTPLPATAQAIATLDAVPVPCGEDLRIGDQPLIESISHNGKWAAYQCYSVSSGNYLIVLSLDGRIRYQASLNDTFAAAPGEASGDTALTLPIHWTIDGRRLFLMTVFPEMESPATAFTDGHALYRLDLLGGRLVQVLAPISGAAGYALEISPNSRYLAYARPEEPAMFHIRDLETGQEVVYSIDSRYDRVGYFAWSADSSRLAFSAAESAFRSGDLSDGFTVFMVDRPTHLVTRLFSSPPGLYTVVAWTSPFDLVLAEQGSSDSPTYHLNTLSFTEPNSP